MFNDIKYIKNNDENSIIRLIIASFGFTLVTNTVNCIVNVFLPNTPIDTIVCYLFFSILILLALPTLIFRLSRISICAFFVVVIMYIFAFINPNSSDYAQSYCIKTIIQAFPFFIIGQSVRDEKKLNETLINFSPFMIIVAAIYYVVILATGGGVREDYMTFSYCLLPFTAMQLLACLEKISIKKIIYLVLSICVHLLTGTRGPVICILVCFVLGVFFSDIRRKTRFILVLLGTALVGFIASPLFSASVSFLNELFFSLGIKNRILTKILSENFWVSTGRKDVANVVLGAISQRPIIGYGFLGDRSLQNGGYPHNFVLEVWCQYGMVLGSVIIITLLIIFIRVFYKRRNNRILLIMLFSVTFVKLMMSGTYPVEGMFFFLLGFCLNKWLNDNCNNEIIINESIGNELINNENFNDEIHN